MRQIITILFLSMAACNPLKRAGKAIEKASSIREKIAASIVIPKDSIIYKPGNTITKTITDTFDNIVEKRYYYYSRDTIERITFDTEKSEALQRLYYEAQGDYKAQSLLAGDIRKRETYQYAAIAILIIIIILQSKFKF